MRTSSTVDNLLEKVPKKDKNYLKSLCGLPLSPYFSAVKMRWLLDNNENVKTAVQENRACFGTVDSWLIYVSPSQSCYQEKTSLLKFTPNVFA